MVHPVKESPTFELKKILRNKGLEYFYEWYMNMDKGIDKYNRFLECCR